jgi:hypothetical protein
MSAIIRNQADSAVEVADADMDSLHTLSLAILPVQHPTLKRARVIKNSRLDTVVEVFKDSGTGSGQIDIEKIQQEFGWPASPPNPDFVLLRKLALMPSYDVYSLRVLLRAEGVQVNDIKALRLSDKKTKELAVYMRNFTRPLMQEIFGGEEISTQSFDDMLSLFKDPDRERAKRRLNIMAAALGISITAIPNFLEDYGDIFLSLSYYRQCLDHITPIMSDFVDSLSEFSKSLQMRRNTTLTSTCNQLNNVFTSLLTVVTGRIESFDRHTKDMWKNISADKFRQVERLIRAYHTNLGGILCALTVKMDAWDNQFPNPAAGGLVRRADFILTDMRHGLEKLKQIEAGAPRISDLAA